MSYVNLGQVMYPVGSIFMSSHSVSPANIFGGTWSALTDQKFLLPSDAWDAVGGEVTHTLTVDEMPHHWHNIQENTQGAWQNMYLWRTNVSGGQLWYMPAAGGMNTATNMRIATDNVGNDMAHNNMPPYRTCFCWVRTA